MLDDAGRADGLEAEDRDRQAAQVSRLALVDLHVASLAGQAVLALQVADERIGLDGQVVGASIGRDDAGERVDRRRTSLGRRPDDGDLVHDDITPLDRAADPVRAGREEDDEERGRDPGQLAAVDPSQDEVADGADEQDVRDDDHEQQLGRRNVEGGQGAQRTTHRVLHLLANRELPAEELLEGGVRREQPRPEAGRARPAAELVGGQVGADQDDPAGPDRAHRDEDLAIIGRDQRRRAVAHVAGRDRRRGDRSLRFARPGRERVLRDVVDRGEVLERKEVREGIGPRLPVAPTDHDELPAVSDPALDGTPLCLVQAAAIAGPHDRRDATQWLGPFGDVARPERERLRSGELAIADELRAQRPRPVADDHDLVVGLLQDADVDSRADRAVRLVVPHRDLSLECLGLDVEHHDLARAGRHLDEAPHRPDRGLGDEVAAGRLALVRQVTPTARANRRPHTGRRRARERRSAPRWPLERGGERPARPAQRRARRRECHGSGGSGSSSSSRVGWIARAPGPPVDAPDQRRVARQRSVRGECREAGHPMLECNAGHGSPVRSFARARAPARATDARPGAPARLGSAGDGGAGGGRPAHRRADDAGHRDPPRGPRRRRRLERPRLLAPAALPGARGWHHQHGRRDGRGHDRGLRRRRRGRPLPPVRARHPRCRAAVRPRAPRCGHRSS